VGDPLASIAGINAEKFVLRAAPASPASPLSPVESTLLASPVFPAPATTSVLSAAPANPSKTRHHFEGNRVLLAEDIEVNREIVIALLEDTHIDVECAENGSEALALFAADPRRYDIILMDVQMPEMDGYEATRRIRALDVPEAKTVPIIALTANVFSEDRAAALASGMNGHLGKPLSQQDMLATLSSFLSARP
jgi:CheY-like chemotaxis protein